MGSWPVLCSGSRHREHYTRHLIPSSHAHQVGSLAPGFRRRNSLKETKQLLTETAECQPTPISFKGACAFCLEKYKKQIKCQETADALCQCMSLMTALKRKDYDERNRGRAFVTLSNNGKANFYLLPFGRPTAHAVRSGRLISNLSWIPAIPLQRLGTGATHAHGVPQHKPRCRKLAGLG